MAIDAKTQAGFVRAYRGNPADAQEEALIAYGVPKLYRAKQGEVPEDALPALRRRGEMLAVAGGLRVLAESRDDVVQIVDEFHSNGYVILDILTERRSDRDGVAMLNDAWKAINRDVRAPDPSKSAEHGRAGGLAKGVNGRSRRMSQREALAIWRNPLYLTAGAAVALMPGWTQRMAYRILGPRETPGGRRPVDYVRQIRLKQLRESGEGIVYFCQAASGGPVKIGYASDAEQRLKTLQTSHATELQLLNAIEGSFEDEKALHKRFAAYRIKGEWFKYTGAVKRYIEGLKPLDEP
jgi:Meiotically up-regulated gene 113